MPILGNFCIVSPRKYGKTGLILHTFAEMKRRRLNYETLYVDIFATLTLEDFTKTLAEAILIKFPEKTSIGKGFVTFLKTLRPTLTYDSISGSPQLQFNYGTVSEKEWTLKSLLEFLNTREKPVVLAFDEFQQITEYPEKTAEALLRTYTQSMQNIRFIFCGSKKKLMAEMFTSAGRPFFSSTMKNAANRILERESDYFLQYRELLTRQQWLLLVAVAKKGSVSKLTSTVFLKKYNIGSSTNARRAAESLQEKELLLTLESKEKQEYQVYDVFLSRWLEREF